MCKTSVLYTLGKEGCQNMYPKHIDISP
jgi:hypothetical protein